MSKITESARGETCTLRFPGCRLQNETTVWCHSPFLEDERGIGIKAPDILGCYGCHHCHDILDGRKFMAGIDSDQKRDYFHIALKRSLLKLVEKGKVVIL